MKKRRSCSLCIYSFRQDPNNTLDLINAHFLPYFISEMSQFINLCIALAWQFASSLHIETSVLHQPCIIVEIIHINIKDVSNLLTFLA